MRARSPRSRPSPGVTLAVEGGVTRPAWPRDAGSAALYSLAAAAGDELGVGVHELASAAAPTRRFAAATGVPTLDGLGPVCHDSCSRDERVEIASIPHWGAILASVAEGAARVSSSSRAL